MYYIFALIQAAIFLIGFVINTAEPSGDLPVPVKIILSLSLVLSALFVRHFNRTKAYTKYVAIGMTFCFIGDLINLNIIPGINTFYIVTFASIAFFGLAHAFFIAAYVKTLRNNGLQVLCKHFYLGMLVCWTITFFSWRFLVFPADRSFMAYGVLAYGLWVSTMAAFSWPLIRIQKKYLFVAAGAFLFVISDLFLAATGIGGIKVHYRDTVIWATYILGLAGIIYSGQFTADSSEK